MSFRPVRRLIKSKPTLEGAGVHLRRAFGFGDITDFDSFLLLDELRSSIPEDYMSGSHGIPAVASKRSAMCPLERLSRRQPRESLGRLVTGDIQWTTAGKRDHSSAEA